MNDHRGDVTELVANDTGGRIVLLVADGLGGLPDPATGLTECETANTPALDALVKESVTGLHVPIAPGITPGSGPAHMALFGYDPVKYEIGRGVLEALGIGFDLRQGDVAIRVNFATVDSSGNITDRRAGRIPTEKCEELTARLDRIEIPGIEVFVRPVKEHRAVIVLRGEGLSGGIPDTDPQRTGVPPLAVEAASAEQEKTASILREFLDSAAAELAGEPAANALTMRGIAALEPLPTFEERFKVKAGAIAGYPMYRGVAGLVGMTVLPAAGTRDEVVSELRKHFDDFDFFFIHFKKTDSTGEDGDFDRKVKATEEFDELVSAVLAFEPDVLLVTGDHSTPAAMASHSWHPVPVIVRSANARVDSVERFGESYFLSGGLGRLRAQDLMPLMLAHAGRLSKFGA